MQIPRKLGSALNVQMTGNSTLVQFTKREKKSAAFCSFQNGSPAIPLQWYFALSGQFTWGQPSVHFKSRTSTLLFSQFSYPLFQNIFFRRVYHNGIKIGSIRPIKISESNIQKSIVKPGLQRFQNLLASHSSIYIVTDVYD